MASSSLIMTRHRNPEVVSRVMARVKSQDTQPEIQLRRILHGLGYRFRLHRSDITGKPDLVFVRQRVAVFVDGDFWHGRQWKTRGFKSLSEQLRTVNNRAYWIKKISGNIARDGRVNRHLSRGGWVVVRIWEGRLKNAPLSCARRVVRALEARQ